MTKIETLLADMLDLLRDRLPEPKGVKDEPERRVNVAITDVYAVPDDYGFLRINVGPETAVIDPDAVNITVTEVDRAAHDPVGSQCRRDYCEEMHDPARDPQADPDTVTLPREVVFDLLHEWEADPSVQVHSRVGEVSGIVRAALGWGDEA